MSPENSGRFKGYVAVSFFRWTATYRAELQRAYHVRTYGNVEGLHDVWAKQLQVDAGDRIDRSTPTERLGVVRRNVLDI